MMRVKEFGDHNSAAKTHMVCGELFCKGQNAEIKFDRLQLLKSEVSP